MAGEIREVVPRSDFNFSNFIPSGGTFTIPIAQNIDISSWREATLIVRVHANTMSATGSPTAKVQVKTVAPTPEDPAVFFRGSTTIAEATVVPANGAGVVHQVAFAANAGGMVTIFLAITQGSSQANFTTTLSVELDLKD